MFARREVTPPFPLPNCIVTKAALQSIANNAVVKVLFDTVFSQYRIQFNTATNDFTILEDGIYNLCFYGTWALNAVGLRSWSIYINAVPSKTFIYSAPVGSSNNPMGVEWQHQLFIGDNIVLNVVQISGAALNFTLPYFSIVKLSGLTS